MDNIILYISGERGLSVLKSLVASRHRVQRVITPGLIATKFDYCGLCEQHNISLNIVKDVNADAYLRSLVLDGTPDIGIICGFPTIFREHLINCPAFGTINLHAGKLPEYRGGSPLNWQLINGEKDITITVIQVDSGIDTGPILAEQKFSISDQDDIADVHQKANGIFPVLVESVLDNIENGNSLSRKQEIEGSCYWHQRNISDGRISWDRSTAHQVHDLVRAITRPYPGAFSYWNDCKVIVYKTAIPRRVIKGVPGHISWVQGEGPYVICNDRAVHLKEYEIPTAPHLRLPTGGILYDRPQKAASFRVAGTKHKYDSIFSVFQEIPTSVQMVEQSFESSLFGRPVFHLTSTASVSRQTLESVCKQGQLSAIGLICCRISPSDTETAGSLSRAGFRHVETLVTMEWRRSEDKIDFPNGVKLAKPEDARILCDISQRAFSYDRFHSDPMIEDRVADALKSAWIANALEGRADAVFVITDNDQILGFCSTLRRETGIIIDLIAVDPDYFWRGYGSRLVQAVLASYPRVDTIQVGTQKNNISSLNLYSRFGFKAIRQVETYHWSPDQDSKQ